MVVTDQKTQNPTTHKGGRGGDKDDPEAHLAALILPVEKTPEDVELIINGLKGNLVCSALKPQEIEALSKEMALYQFTENMDVCREGDNGSHFFIVNEGEFSVCIGGKCVATLAKTDTFGEIALIHNVPRSATISCTSDQGACWGVQRSQFRDVLKQLSTRNFAENRKFLEQVQILEILTEAQKTMITNALVEESVADGNTIIKEGQSGDVLYIIKNGKCSIWIKGDWKRDLNRGDYFGERALLYDELRSATVTAKGPVTVLSIGRELLTTVLGNLQHVLFRNMMVIAVKESETFNNFTQEQVDGIIQSVIIKDYPENYTILDRGSRAKDVRFFIVLEGSVLLSKDNVPLRFLSRGHSFGEDYVKQLDIPFPYRVDSIEATKLGLITTNIFDMCLGSDMTQTIEHNLKRKVLRNIYIFRYLGQQQFDHLISNFQGNSYKKGEPVFLEGEIGNQFYIIKEGEVEIVLDNVPGTGGPKGTAKRIRTMGKHDYFGERALLYNEPRSASIYANKDTEVWTVDKPIFQSALQGNMLKHLEERIEMQNTRVSFEELCNVCIVGRGTFGVVREVYVKNKPHQRYALKANSRYKTILDGMTDMVRNENEIGAEVNHPFILKLIKTFKDEQYLYFLTELIKGGELHEAMQKIGLCNKTSAQFYVGSIILFMEYLHERSIVYRDLKPENILLDSGGYLKLIDFGTAKKIPAGGRTYTLVGTPEYMSPELLLGKGYGLSVDLWGIGVTCYELICGEKPFMLEEIPVDDNHQIEVMRHILNSKLKFPKVADKPTYDKDNDMELFVKRLLQRRVEERLGCSAKGYKEIKEHPMFEGFDFDKLITRVLPPPLMPDLKENTEEGGSCRADNAGLEKVERPDPKQVAGFSDTWDAGFEPIP